MCSILLNLFGVCCCIAALGWELNCLWKSVCTISLNVTCPAWPCRNTQADDHQFKKKGQTNWLYLSQNCQKYFIIYKEVLETDFRGFKWAFLRTATFVVDVNFKTRTFLCRSWASSVKIVCSLLNPWQGLRQSAASLHSGFFQNINNINTDINILFSRQVNNEKFWIDEIIIRHVEVIATS